MDLHGFHFCFFLYLYTPFTSKHAHSMTHPLYGYSLCAAVALMLFFGIYFLVARTPDKPIFDNYLRSRRIMGIALLVLAANYIVHIMCELRFSHPDQAIFLNLSTYYLSAWLFSSALTLLLDRNYLAGNRFLRHIFGWLLFTGVSGVVLLLLPAGIPQLIGLLIMAVWFFAYAFRLARRLVRTYRKAVRVVDDFHSDHIAAYIRWLSIFTYWAVVYGVGCGLLTFLPERYVFLWILSSIPFYVYLYCSYMNYLLFYEQVERILESEMEAQPETGISDGADATPVGHSAIPPKLTVWLDRNGFTQPGLTIEELAEMLGTNRTYLADYIKTSYHISFREWITMLRLEYAKRMLIKHPEQTVSWISEASGFLSQSHFTRIFTEKEACSPARWRKSKG